MKAHEAACSIKVVILICDRDRDWKSGYPCWNSAFFLFSHSPFFHLTFCHSTAGKNRTRGRYVSSAKLGDKTKRMKPDVLWASRCFHSGLWGDSVFEHGPPPPPPQCRYSPWSESSDWAPRERSRSTQIFVCQSVLSVSHFCQVWQLIKLK